MIYAYDKLYIDHASVNFAFMLDFAVNDLGYDLKKFFDMFLFSSYSKKFEKGDFSVLVGRSGIELVYCVLDELQIKYERKPVSFKPYKSVEYWVGWALSYYQ